MDSHNLTCVSQVNVPLSTVRLAREVGRSGLFGRVKCVQ
jgi:hypothetical protein